MSYIGNPIVTAAFVTDQFNGTGSQTAFTMSVAPANTASILVIVSGVTQSPDSYSINGLTLTFSAAPPTGTGNISVRYLGIPASGVTTTAYRTLTEFTATAGQTTFTPPSYTVGYITVLRNGVQLGTADFTATNGTTVVLASGATAGDLVTTISFYVSSVLNAIPAVANAVTDTYLNAGAVTQSKVATGVAGTGPAFYAYSNANQTISNAVNTLVTNNSEVFDTANCFNTSTYTFTPNVAGYYSVTASIRDNSGGAAGNQFISWVYKNGTFYSGGINNFAGTGIVGITSATTCLVYLNGTTDYIQQYVYQNQGSNLTTNAGLTWSYFQGFLARAA